MKTNQICIQKMREELEGVKEHLSSHNGKITAETQRVDRFLNFKEELNKEIGEAEQ